MQKKPTTIASHFNIDPKNLDFANVDLSDDIPLYVDPLLLWRSPYRDHHIVHGELVHFFETAISNAKSGKKHIAERMFDFPEPENLIGSATSGHDGRGMRSGGLASDVFHSIFENKGILEHGLKFLNELQLNIHGIGPDLISDMTVNIAKRFFVDYTNRQCEIWKIPVSKCTTRVFLWDELDWDEIAVELPIHPETGDPFLLTPKILLRRGDLNMKWEDFYGFFRELAKDRILSSRWNGIGKPPRVTYKEIAKEYPFTKGFVTELLEKEPELRTTFVGTVTRNVLQNSREVTVENLGIPRFGPVISIEALRQIFAGIPTASKELKVILENAIAASDENAEYEKTVPLTEQIESLFDRSMDELVVILGSYTDAQKETFEKTKQIVADETYTPCIIKDMKDVGNKNPREKVFTYVAPCRFVVVLDFVASGHFNEIELLKDLGIPIILISQKEIGPTYMLHGIDRTHSFIQRYPITTHGSLENALQSGISWAEKMIYERNQYNIETLPWLKPPEPDRAN